LNEQEVEARLHELGFETCTVEALPLRAQVELFAEASIVVSTMGASFASVLFSPPGTVIVDMVPPEMLNLGYVYWEMCEELHHEY
jgi:capsular polysaccharide biosynthesis protein